jgi:hypothetical protein
LSAGSKQIEFAGKRVEEPGVRSVVRNVFVAIIDLEAAFHTEGKGWL